jgi:hypothetical protein
MSTFKHTSSGCGGHLLGAFAQRALWNGKATLRTLVRLLLSGYGTAPELEVIFDSLSILNILWRDVYCLDIVLNYSRIVAPILSHRHVDQLLQLTELALVRLGKYHQEQGPGEPEAELLTGIYRAVVALYSEHLLRLPRYSNLIRPYYLWGGLETMVLRCAHWQVKATNVLTAYQATRERALRWKLTQLVLHLLNVTSFLPILGTTLTKGLKTTILATTPVPSPCPAVRAVPSQGMGR